MFNREEKGLVQELYESQIMWKQKECKESGESIKIRTK